MENSIGRQAGRQHHVVDVHGDQPKSVVVCIQGRFRMQIRIGYELVYECPQPTPMILMLNIHFTRVSDLIIADHIITTPPTPLTP
jgi:hypothetical protein